MSNEINVYDVVKKLIGPIEPVGESHTDAKRMENLEKMTALINQLLADVDQVIPFKDRVEFSMKRAGEHASKFFDRLGIED